MDCSEFLDRYSEYDDSLVSGDERRRFESHLAACDACARYDRVLRKGRMLARQLPRAESSSDFMPDLQTRLWASRAHPLGLTSGPIVSGALTLATLLMVASAATALLDDGRLPVEPVPMARMAAGEPSSAARRASTRVERLAVVTRAFRGNPARAHRSGGALSEVSEAWSGSAAGAGGVDRRETSSYSPLVIGPPAYRPGALTRTSATTRRTLD